MNLVTVILPISDLKDSALKARLQSAILNTTAVDWVQVVVSHVGTEPIDLSLLVPKKNLERTDYIFDHNIAFSKTRALNQGALASSSEWVFFLDIDLVGTEEFWPRMRELLRSEEFAKEKHAFLVIPVKQLPPPFQLRGDQVSGEVLGEILAGVVLDSVPFSSAIILKRANFIELGGYLDHYEEWGFEDFEFALWMISSRFRWKKPALYSDDLGFASFSTTDYVGFRSQLKLLSRRAQAEGLELFHVWHPPTTWKSADGISTNRKILKSQLQSGFSISRPLRHPANGLGLLIIGQREAWPWKGLEMQIRQFGSHEIYVSESRLERMAPADFRDWARSEGLGYLLTCRTTGASQGFIEKLASEANLRTVTFGRGYLPQSWFFSHESDGEPEIHQAQFLDRRTPSADSIKSVETLLARLDRDGKALELQDAYFSVSNTTPPGEKPLVLFLLPDQDNSAVFGRSGPFLSYATFFQMLEALIPKLIKSGRTVAVRPHPAVPAIPTWLDALRLEVPIESACKSAHVVVSGNDRDTFYGLSQNRPTISFGRNSPFTGTGLAVEFQHPFTTNRADYVDSLAELIKAPPPLNFDSVEKRIANLLDLYSFTDDDIEAISKQERDVDRPGKAFNFRQLVFDGVVFYRYPRATRWRLSDFGVSNPTSITLRNALRIGWMWAKRPGGEISGCLKIVRGLGRRSKA